MESRAMKLSHVWAAVGILGLSVLPLLIRADPHAPSGSVTFKSPGNPVVVPFLFRNNHILLRGRVNRSDSLWFILDTGASGHVLNRSTSDRLGLSVRGQAHAMGAGGQVQVGMLQDVHFKLPGLDVSAPMVAAIPLDGLATQTGHPCDGIIGYSLFQERSWKSTTPARF
jgi:hypothetical protein